MRTFANAKQLLPMDLVTDFSWIGVAGCAALGVAYAAVLYAFGKRSGIGRKSRAALAMLRFVAVFFISFLLLSPMTKRRVVETEKPVVVLVHDNSRSVVLTADSAYYRTGYLQNVEQLKQSLSANYQVEEHSFGGDLQNGFNRKFDQEATNISLALNQIQDIYKGRNVAAVVLATDGIANAGNVPQTSAGLYPYPIYTIALGDTAIRNDAAIKSINANKITYLNSQFPVKIAIKADKLQGNSARLTVQKEGKILFSKQINYSLDRFFTTESVLLDADKAGVQLYTVRLDVCNGEVSTANNVQTFAVEVLDSRRRVAIVGQAPHPDIGAMKRYLENSETYEVETFAADKFAANPQQYHLFVLHQLPDNNPSHNTLVTKVLQQRIPTLFVLGQQTSFASFDRLQLGLAINAGSSRSDEATAVVNPSFSHFSADNDLWGVEAFPPLTVPFGNVQCGSGTQTLLFAKVGSVQTQRPLVAFAQKNGVRYGFVVGEGLWRWPLADYSDNGSSEVFATLMDKTCTYLSAQANKQQFNVKAAASFAETEVITLNAELYNDNYELVNTPDATLTVSDGHGQSRDYSFRRTQNSYSVAIGTLPQGRYSYLAKTTLGGKTFSQIGNFVVQRLVLEKNSLTADHQLLNTIARNTGGLMLYPQQMLQLPELLQKRHDIRNVMYSRYKYSELINLPWLFVAIVLLLAAEWVARRYKNEI